MSKILKRKSELDNLVVLMVGGLGTRLRSVSNQSPKPLVKIGNKPILEIILDSFIESGCKHFLFAVNYKSEMIESYFGNGSKWGVKIEYLRERKTLGTAGALGLLPFMPQQSLFIMNGDLITKVNFREMLNFHLKHAGAATIGVREYYNTIPYGIVKIKGHSVLGIKEKPVQRLFVNAGIYILTPEVLSLVPRNYCFSMPDLLTRIIQNGLKISAFPIREYWLDVGTADGLNRARNEYFEFFDG